MTPCTIRLISRERMHTIIDRYAPIGRYMTREGRKWVACDNTTGDAWVEEFDTMKQAVKWLMNA